MKKLNKNKFEKTRFYKLLLLKFEHFTVLI